jgi:NAD-dependent deacetylase
MHFAPQSQIDAAAEIIRNAKHVTVFTGAGISVESGIPPFRGADGLWSKYNPIVLDISYFFSNPLESWKVIKEIFYDFFGKAEPNPAHFAISELEHLGIVKSVITQNIDGLHQEAGSKRVFEFHGTSKFLTCIDCAAKYPVEKTNIDSIPPRCPKCGGLLKPDFVFFGEQIPPDAHKHSFAEAEVADVFLVVGTTGEIMPASLIPRDAKENGATIIEVNTAPSKYTNHITDIFLKGKASVILSELTKKSR